MQVHPAGHLGCLTLRPSAESKLTAATQTRSVHPFQPLHPLTALPGSPIFLLSRSCTITPAHATYWPNPQRFVTTDLSVSDFFFIYIYINVFLCRCCCARMQAWCLCFLRLNRKAPVQRIRSAKHRITNAGQTGRENREMSQIFFSYFCHERELSRHPK